ncbi:hypothetical protein AKO1_006339 [Acrasis kona]|uniref:HAT C-terminal dimerisation domain-containing protein n=1 Tax=Acrasis kona TaxID=1008807 RepID=A0AAW2YJ60_9EUKA
MLKELNLISKVLTITADNATNMESLVKVLNATLRTTYRQNLPVFEGEDGYIRCLAHIINLISKDLMQALKAGAKEDSYEILDKMDAKQNIASLSSIMKVRTVVLHIKDSPQRRERWLGLCNNDQQKQFIDYDIHTRWNSTYLIIDSALRFSRELVQYTQSEELDDLTINQGDWMQLEQVRNVLKKLDQMTKFLSSSSPQIANSLAIYYQLSDLLDDISQRKKKYKNVPIPLAEAVKASIEKYQKYYSLMDRSLFYYIAATLDPRSRAIWIENYKQKSILDFIVKQIIEKLKVDNDVQNEEENIPTPPSSDFSVNAMMLQSNKANRVLLSDVDRYYNSGVVSGDPNGGFKWVLSWWKDNAAVMPVMSKVARRYLAIPAASVSAERMFNAGRDIMDIRRQLMCATTFCWLMLFQDHYKHKN